MPCQHPFRAMASPFVPLRLLTRRRYPYRTAWPQLLTSPRCLSVILQGFVRSTTKYWVRTGDVSTVKHTILQHLPVFQFDKDNFAGDAQLVNSTYMDNR